MPKGLRRKTKQYVLDQFQEDDPEAYFKYKVKTSYGLTQQQMEFLQAVQFASTQKVKNMLDHGVDPNFYVEPSRQTPLHFAVEVRPAAVSASEKIVGAMLFLGADPNMPDSEGRTPLHVACKSGRSSIVELLLQAGADVCVCDDSGDTPLLVACSHTTQDSGHMVRLLLNNGAQVNHVNQLGQSALHMLTSPDRGRLSSLIADVRADVGLMLLQHGLCAHLKDSRGVAPLGQELQNMSEQPTSLTSPQLATVLLCAGASLDTQIIMKQGSKVVDALMHLILELEALVPRTEQHKLLKQLDKLPEPRSANTLILLDMLERSLNTVITLQHMCRASIRVVLGGQVMSATQDLPLPDKIKDFIVSC